ncbi:MAG: RNA 2',3'-cyclic phosphodiesterase [Nanoarchaeota archaeon]|nr:RNA 2',3'-cyclic phosphodiesterase [Nanoarchaeota archaeon]
MIRCFIAVDLSLEAVKEIERAQRELSKKKTWQGKITEPANLHLTLKFLGEIEEERVEEVRRRLREIKFPKFSCYIGNLGVFTPNNIKIVWAHIIGNEVLGLQKWVDESLWDMFPKEKRFMSHLTIARVKMVKDKKLFLQELEKVKTQNLKFPVKNFYLIKSELREKGPVYTTLEKFELK